MNRNKVKVVRMSIILSLLLSAAVAACSQNTVTCATDEVFRKDRPADRNPTQNPAPSEIPPIDIATPPVFETAAFGLG